MLKIMSSVLLILGMKNIGEYDIMFYVIET